MAHATHRDIFPNANFKEGVYDKDAFICEMTKDGLTLNLAWQDEGKASKKHKCSVPAGRANKALKTLHPYHIGLSLRHSCGCTKECNNKFTADDVVRKRDWYLSFANELAATSGLVADLLPYTNREERKISYGLLSGASPATQTRVSCCANFYMQAVGIHDTKLARVREACYNGSVNFLHGNAGKKYVTKVQLRSRLPATWKCTGNRML